MENIEKTNLVDDDKLELPPDLDSIETRESNKSSKGPFSLAIFKESFKSNWLGTLICGIGNALILVIIVVILSTLNINATKTALSDMFSSADMESELKTGAVGMYSVFDQTASSYEQINDGSNQAIELSESIYKGINDEENQTLATNINGMYDTIYSTWLLGGRNSTRTKNYVNTFVVAYVDNELTDAQKSILQNIGITLPEVDLTDDQKTVIKEILPYYLDEYYVQGYTNGIKNSTSVVIRNVFVNTIYNYCIDALKTKYNLTDEESLTAATTLKNQITSFNEIYDSTASSLSEDQLNALILKMATESSFDLIPLLADSSSRSQVENIVGSMKNAYYYTDNTSTDYKSKYMNDTDLYRSKTISESLQKEVLSSFVDTAYYNYLEAFEVLYKTDDLGYPINYKDTGEKDSSGNTVIETIRYTTYEPDNFLKVQSDMGTPATLVQKMHKDILTGEAYSEDEVDEAKKKAQEEIDNSMTARLSSFMDEYIVRDDKNSNTYYDGTSINEVAIATRANGIVVEIAINQVIEDYNKKNGTNITSIDQITADKYSMDGKSISDTLYSYSASGISSFRTLYSNNISKGYSNNDAILSAMVKSCAGVIDQLPNKVNDSLSEMGEMNTYGVFVGVVTFGMASVLIPMVYTIILANSLTAEKVETGSLSFTMSTPIKRSTFIFTEGAYLIFTEVALGLMLYLGGLIARECGIAAGGSDLIDSLPISDISKYAFGNFMVTLAISAICFCASSIFNKTRYAIAYGGGINIFFFICSILGLFGTKAIPGTARIDAMNYFNYVTILSLNDAISVMDGSAVYWYKLIGLVAIAIVCYIAGGIVFTKKDLPL